MTRCGLKLSFNLVSKCVRYEHGYGSETASFEYQDIRETTQRDSLERRIWLGGGISEQSISPLE